MTDGFLQIASLPAGEYWIQRFVENVEGEYRYQDALLPVWFRITNDGELQTMPATRDED